MYYALKSVSAFCYATKWVRGCVCVRDRGGFLLFLAVRETKATLPFAMPSKLTNLPTYLCLMAAQEPFDSSCPSNGLGLTDKSLVKNILEKNPKNFLKNFLEQWLPGETMSRLAFFDSSLALVS